MSWRWLQLGTSLKSGETTLPELPTASQIVLAVGRVANALNRKGVAVRVTNDELEPSRIRRHDPGAVRQNVERAVGAEEVNPRAKRR